MVTLDNTFNRDPWILHLDNSLEFAIGNSKTQPPLKCSLLAQWGSGIEFLISAYSCNVLTICHSLTRPGLNLNSEFWSSNHVCFLPWWVLTVETMAKSQFLQRIHFNSPCQFVLGTLICSDGWEDAWNIRESQTTHQHFLLVCLLLTPADKMSEKDFLKRVPFIASEFCQIQVTL